MKPLPLIIGGAAALVAGAGIILLPSAPEVESVGRSAVAPQASASRPFAAGKESSAVARSKPASASVEPATKAARSFTARAQSHERMPRDGEREKNLRNLILDWAAVDPRAAEIWAAGLADEGEREIALTHVALTWAELDPRAAAEMARWRRLPRGITEAVVQRWGKKDFASAVNWAKRLEAGAEREGILARIFVGHAETNPEEAAAMVSSELRPGTAQAEAAISVLYLWLPRDAAAATQWVSRFPAGDLRARAENEIAGYLKPREEDSSL